MEDVAVSLGGREPAGRARDVAATIPMILSGAVAGWRKSGKKQKEEADGQVVSLPEVVDEKENEKEDDEDYDGRGAEESAHSLASRIGNFKISKLARLIEDLAVACGSDKRLDVRSVGMRTAAELEPDDAADEQEVEQTETAEDRQARVERSAVEEAIRILKIVRDSDVHRGLPHFHIVDRQLETASLQLEEVVENIGTFWSYGREEPMSELLALPIMQLASSGGHEALVPLPENLQSSGPSDADVAIRSCSEVVADAAAFLGWNPETNRRDLELAYRREARKLHRHGQCIDRDAFHRLSEAYQICTLERLATPNMVPKGGSDILAHYLLVGTDPRGSRYHEYARGVLDAPNREQLLQKIDVLLNWGEVSGSTTGLGQG